MMLGRCCGILEGLEGDVKKYLRVHISSYTNRYITIIAVNDAVHDSEPLFPAFDSPNHHAPHFKVIICIDADRLEVLVGRT